jgi:hypothetical protein
LHGVGDGRGFKLLLVLRRARAQARLQPDIEFFADGNDARLSRSDVRRRLRLLGGARRDSDASERNHDYQ